MKEIWTKKWKTVLIWASGYLNFLALVLVGGYFYVKNEDEELQTVSKRAFWVTLIFAAISAFLSLFNYVGGFFNQYYSSSAYEFYSICNKLYSMARIIVYAVYIILALVKKEDSASIGQTDSEKTE